MATESRRAPAAVADALQHEPWRFEFFQAVRLLEAMAHHATGVRGAPRLAPVGHAAASSQELVRFRTALSRGFPASEITGLVLGDEASPTARMEVAFIGLTGPLGVLPEHYLDLLYRQVRKRDRALRDFFDLFNHRTVSLYYRAWEKYRPVVAYERARRGTGDADPLTRMLKSLVGLGTAGLADRLACGDRGVLAYAGHLAHAPRSAWALQTLLSDLFGVAADIEPFVGRWLPLAEEQCSRLPGVEVPGGQFNRLGVDSVLGTRAWDEQGKFRVRLGPMDYRRFASFLPDSPETDAGFVALCGLVRMYAGIDHEFDIRLVLAAGEVPALTLGRGPGGFEPRLGWNTWLGGAAGPGDRDEALFEPVHGSAVEAAGV
jgi:type VI secretion system protein ImpH